MTDPRSKRPTGAADSSVALLQARIGARLSALGLTARAASLAAGLGPDAIRTVYKGHSPAPQRLQALAQVLMCDVRYLLGEVDEPDGSALAEDFPLRPKQRREVEASNALQRRGEVIEGYWHPEGRPLAVGRPVTVIEEDAMAFAHCEQWVTLLSDISMGAVVPHGALLHVVSAKDLEYEPQPQDLVIVERRRSGFVEYTMKMVYRNGDILALRTMPFEPIQPYALPIGRFHFEGKDDEVSIIGLVVKAYIQLDHDRLSDSDLDLARLHRRRLREIESTEMHLAASQASCERRAANFRAEAEELRAEAKLVENGKAEQFLEEAESLTRRAEEMQAEADAMGRRLARIRISKE